MIIPFGSDQRKRYYQLLDQVFDSNFWSEGKMLRSFEESFGAFTGLGARAVCNGGSGLLTILEYIDVKGKDVVVPSNTFWASAQAVKKAGGNVIYADSNKTDLSLSFDDMKEKITDETVAVILVHIGGHIAFESEKIASYCKEKDIYLVEDCAHAHGATWNGKSAGSYGFAGSYSFYATKTMPTGDGGMIVSSNEDFLQWVERFRNYGKEVIDGVVTYPITSGFNYRLNEVTAALGIVQLENLPKVLEWKRALAEKYDKIFENRVMLPDGMVSGYYKYIVFGYDKLKQRTGQVFGINDLGHKIEGKDICVPNAEWITSNHQCAPIYYGWEMADKSTDELKALLLG